MTNNKSNKKSKSYNEDRYEHSDQITKTSLSSDKELTSTGDKFYYIKDTPDNDIAKYIRDINVELYQMIPDKKMPFMKYLIGMVIEEALNIEKKCVSK